MQGDTPSASLGTAMNGMGISGGSQTQTIQLTQVTGDNGREYYELDGGAAYADVEKGLVYSAEDEKCSQPIGKHNGDGTWRLLEQAEQAEFARLERAARAAAQGRDGGAAQKAAVPSGSDSDDSLDMPGSPKPASMIKAGLKDGSLKDDGEAKEALDPAQREAAAKQKRAEYSEVASQRLQATVESSFHQTQMRMLTQASQHSRQSAASSRLAARNATRLQALTVKVQELIAKGVPAEKARLVLETIGPNNKNRAEAKMLAEISKMAATVGNDMAKELEHEEKAEAAEVAMKAAAEEKASLKREYETLQNAEDAAQQAERDAEGSVQEGTAVKKQRAQDAYAALFAAMGGQGDLNAYLKKLFNERKDDDDDDTIGVLATAIEGGQEMLILQQLHEFKMADKEERIAELEAELTERMTEKKELTEPCPGQIISSDEEETEELSRAELVQLAKGGKLAQYGVTGRSSSADIRAALAVQAGEPSEEPSNEEIISSVYYTDNELEPEQYDAVYTDDELDAELRASNAEKHPYSAAATKPKQPNADAQELSHLLEKLDVKTVIETLKKISN